MQVVTSIAQPNLSRQMLLTVTGFLLFLSAPDLTAGKQIVIVSPPDFEDVEGSTATPASCCPEYLRFQQVFPAEDFVESLPGGRGLLTGFAWRPDAFGVEDPLTIGPARWEIRLSTTERVPGNLSRAFAENIGPDELTVLNDVITIETANIGPFNGPKAFDYIVQFEDAFLYDANQGSLLMDYIFVEGVTPNPIADSYVERDGLAVSLATDVLNGGASTASWGLVHKFFFLEVLPKLQPGDADQDLDFDQLDLVKVQIAAKYLTGQSATWGEGDWDGAPGGEPGSPPPGNGLFDQLDIIVALSSGLYLQGPYAAIAAGGVTGDGQTSVGYDASTGELWVDAPAGAELTSIHIDSAGGIFTGDAAQSLGGSFDNDADRNIFKATFGGSFGSLSFGNVARPGMSEDFVLNDLSVVGSLAGGGALGEVDLIYVPEPATVILLAVGALFAAARRRNACVWGNRGQTLSFVDRVGCSG